MGKLAAFVIVPVCVLFLALAGLYAYVEATDPVAQKYRDRVEYPLQKVDAQDTASYVLVKWQHASKKQYYVVTDTEAIKANAAVFSVENDGSLYGTTAGGLILLYRDGVCIASTPFDPQLTRRIEQGTLRFRSVNELQFYLLIGDEIMLQGEGYTILRNTQGENPYYSYFAHGESTEGTANVHLLGTEHSLSKLPGSKKVDDDLVEFIISGKTYVGNETKHWFLRLSDGELSESFLNVRAVQDGRVVCTASTYLGSKIVVRDIFDKKNFYKEITGDFSQSAKRLFLLSAAFTADGKVRIEYLGADELLHTDVFPLD